MSRKMTMATNKTDIKELSQDELISWLRTRGMQPYRAGQILRWIYQRQTDTFDAMTDLGKAFRQKLTEQFTIDRLKVVKVETSQDGSKKFLFEMNDGACIESVLIPEENHYTLCISSQVGCAQGCRFCLTATAGFARNLTKGEIVAQVRDIAGTLDNNDSRRLTNIVFMGMGEPLANYRPVVNAIQTLTDQDAGIGLSSRRVTLSTAGLVSKLADLGRDTAIKLAVSLNAADDRTRSRLMPINQKYPIEKLIDTCRRYPLKPGRRITFEYILIRGINDTEEDARKLASLLRPVRAKINLIPFNAHDGCDFKRSDESATLKFQDILLKKNYTAIIRRSKGLDISAACGQLRVRHTTGG